MGIPVVAVAAALIAFLVAGGLIARRLLHEANKPDAPRKRSIPVWLTCLIVATPFYFGAMYWASMGNDTEFTFNNVYSTSEKRYILKRPFDQLLDSKFSVTVVDVYFRDISDTDRDEFRSPVQLFENGKGIGPAHTVLYHVAVLGMGRYKHWKGNHSIFAFSSSDNTDPNTNGRVYSVSRMATP